MGNKEIVKTVNILMHNFWNYCNTSNTAGYLKRINGYIMEIWCSKLDNYGALERITWKKETQT